MSELAVFVVYIIVAAHCAWLIEEGLKVRSGMAYTVGVVGLIVSTAYMFLGG